jgi:Xaa-Pro aminopeptidase
MVSGKVSDRHSYEQRLDHLVERTGERGLDALLVTSDESIAYLTGFRPVQLERFFGVVVAPGQSAVIVPALDRGQIDEAPPQLIRISYGAESDGMPELAEALADARTVGVEEDHLIYARARALGERGFELAPAGSVVMGLRIAKDAAEIERIRAACELVEAGLRRAFEWLSPGVVEHALNARVEGWLREQGASGAHPLILFGENAANPHADPGPRCARATSCAPTCRPASTGTGVT